MEIELVPHTCTGAVNRRRRYKRGKQLTSDDMLALGNLSDYIYERLFVAETKGPLRIPLV